MVGELRPRQRQGRWLLPGPHLVVPGLRGVALPDPALEPSFRGTVFRARPQDDLRLFRRRDGVVVPEVWSDQRLPDGGWMGLAEASFCAFLTARFRCARVPGIALTPGTP